LVSATDPHGRILDFHINRKMMDEDIVGSREMINGRGQCNFSYRNDRATLLGRANCRSERKRKWSLTRSGVLKFAQDRIHQRAR
jgi:hypothetical protein